MAELEDRLLIALRVARHHRLDYWNNRLEEHRHHPTFRVHTWPFTREYGFSCSCSGTEQEWRIDIGCLKEMIPGARESLMRLYRHHLSAGSKLQRREQRLAEVKAKALLHRYLTKEQRLELRKTNAFTAKAKDGKNYLITRVLDPNVFIEHEGTKYALCVIPKEWLPTYDTLLAQKIMLETDPEAFLRLAVVTNTKTKEHYKSGAFLLGEVEPKPHKLLPLVELTHEQIENPREWVETRCRD